MAYESGEDELQQLEQELQSKKREDGQMSRQAYSPPQRAGPSTQNEEIYEVTAELLVAQSKYQSVMREMSELKVELERKNGKSSAEMDSLRSQLGDLQHENASMTKKIHNLTHQLETAKKERLDAVMLAEQQEMAVSQQMLTLQKVHQSLLTESRELSEHQRAIQQAQISITESVSRFRQQEDQDMKAAMHYLQAAYEQCKAELEEARRQGTTLRQHSSTTLSGMESRLEEMMSTLRTIKAQIDDQTNALEETKKEDSMLLTYLEELQSIQTNLKRDHAKKEETLRASHLEELQSLQASLKRDHEAKLAEQHTAVVQLRRDHESELSQTHAAIAQLKREHEMKLSQLRGEHHEAIAELNAAQHSALAQLTSALQTSVGKLTVKMEEGIENIRRDVAEITNEIASVKEGSNSVVTQMKEQSRALAEIKRQDEELKTWVDEMNLLHANVKRELHSAKEATTAETVLLLRILSALGKDHLRSDLERSLPLNAEPFVQREMVASIIQIQTARDEALRQSEEVRRSINQGNAALQRQASDAVQEVEAAKKRAFDIASQLSETEEKYALSQKQIERLELRLKSTEGQEKIDLLHAQVVQVEQERDHFEALMKDQDRKYQRCQAEAADMKEEVAIQTELVTKLRGLLEQVSADLQEQQAESHTTARTLQEAHRTLKHMHDDAEARQQALSTAMSEFQRAEEECVSLRKQLETSKRELAASQQELASTKSRLITAEARLEETKQECEDLLVREKTENDRVRTALQLEGERYRNMWESDTQKHSETMQIEKQTVSILQQRVASLDERVMELGNERDALRTEISDLHAKHADSLSQLHQQHSAEVTSLHERYSSEITTLRSQFTSDLSNEKERSQSQLELLRVSDERRIADIEEKLRDSLSKQQAAEVHLADSLHLMMERDALLQKVDEMRMQFEQATAQYTADRQTLRTQVHLTSRRYEESNQKQSDTVQKLQVTAATLKEKSERLEEASSHLIAIQSELLSVKQENEELSKAKSALIRSLEDVRQQAVTNSVDKEKQHSEQIEAERSHVRLISETLAAAQSDIEKMRGEKQELATTMDSLTGQLADSETKRTEQEAQIVELTAAVAQLKIDVEAARKEAQLGDVVNIKQQIESRIRPEVAGLSRQSLDWAEYLKALQTRVSQQEELISQFRARSDEQLKQVRSTVRESLDKMGKVQQATPMAAIRAQDELRLVQIRADDLATRNQRQAEVIQQLELKVVDMEKQLKSAKSTTVTTPADAVPGRSKLLVDKFVNDVRRRAGSGQTTESNMTDMPPGSTTSLPIPPM